MADSAGKFIADSSILSTTLAASSSSSSSSSLMPARDVATEGKGLKRPASDEPLDLDTVDKRQKMTNVRAKVIVDYRLVPPENMVFTLMDEPVAHSIHGWHVWCYKEQLAGMPSFWKLYRREPYDTFDDAQAAAEKCRARFKGKFVVTVNAVNKPFFTIDLTEYRKDGQNVGEVAVDVNYPEQLYPWHDRRALLRRFLEEIAYEQDAAEPRHLAYNIYKVDIDADTITLTKPCGESDNSTKESGSSLAMPDYVTPQYGDDECPLEWGNITTGSGEDAKKTVGLSEEKKQ